MPGRAEQMTVTSPHLVLGTEITPPFPERLETAVFGMGCFWGAERKFWSLPGVYTTAVGYSGGFTPNPTYHEVCRGRTGHAEVVLVVFDPTQISYEQLLGAFFEGHDPTQGMRQGNDVGTQYRSAVYTTTPEQAELAEVVAARFAGVLGVGGPGEGHDRDRTRRGLLLRRALPPAVSRGEPRWILRPGRDRYLVSRGPGRRLRGPSPRRPGRLVPGTPNVRAGGSAPGSALERTSAQPDHVSGDQRRSIRREIGDHRRNLVGRGDSVSCLPGEGGCAVVDPPRVGDGGCTTFAVTPKGASSFAALEGEVHLGRLCRAVGNLFWEPATFARGQPDDAAPLPALETCRRANWR